MFAPRAARHWKHRASGRPDVMAGFYGPLTVMVAERRILARLWSCVQQGAMICDDRLNKSEGMVRDTWDLLHALALLRRSLPRQAGGLSTPSSGTTLVLDSYHTDSLARTPRRGRSVGSTGLKLRQILAASIFSQDEEIEDARDMVIDMVYGSRRDSE